MLRIFVFLFIVCFIQVYAYGQAQRKGFYLGILSYPENNYRLLLNLDDSALYVMGFRANRIPLKNFIRDRDKVRFSRADFFSRFEGAFDAQLDQITGRWTDEERKVTKIDFKKVDPDTVRGFRPRVRAGFGYTVPQGEDGIQTRSIPDVNIDPLQIEDFLTHLDRGDFEYVHSLLICRNGYLVFEDYFYNFSGSITFGIQSVTKSFVSALTGIAIGRGELGSVHDLLGKWIDREYQPAVDQANVPISLHHIMSMTTGFEWDEVSYDYGDERNNLSQTESRDPFRFLFQRRRIADSPFAYNSLNHALMNMVLRKATGLANEAEMTSRILEPLQISHYDLGKRDDNGLIGDISLRPRDMLKFGLMYLNRGKFAGTQIVPADWVETSTASKVHVKDNLGYGYFWWTTTYEWKGRRVDAYFAWGYGGQYIIVVPELALVVVMNGTNWSTDPEKYARQIMQDYIIPACR
jgi:CubicO group peptidase (beta-lactamase class C family)